MSYSVRFNVGANSSITGSKNPEQQAQLFETAKSALGKNGSYSHNGDFEFKIDHHLLAFRERFISDEFLKAFRLLSNRDSSITIVTGNYGQFGINEQVGSARPIVYGSTKISFEKHNVFMQGKNIDAMIAMYLVFCKNNASLPSFKEQDIAKRLREGDHARGLIKIQNTMVESLHRDKKTLEERLSEETKMRLQAEKDLKDLQDAKPFWKFWL